MKGFRLRRFVDWGCGSLSIGEDLLLNGSGVSVSEAHFMTRKAG